MRTGLTQKLTFAALMGALAAVLSQIQIPLPPVPINLALSAVYLCGWVLGGRTGAAAMAAYALLGGAGLPVFSGFAGGPSILFGPSGGFIFGYILCAGVCGALVRRCGMRMRGLLLSAAAGTLACYASGVLWFMASTGAALYPALCACVLPFLPGDCVKAYLAARLCLRIQIPLRAMGLDCESP